MISVELTFPWNLKEPCFPKSCSHPDWRELQLRPRPGLINTPGGTRTETMQNGSLTRQPVGHIPTNALKSQSRYEIFAPSCLFQSHVRQVASKQDIYSLADLPFSLVLSSVADSFAHSSCRLSDPLLSTVRKTPFCRLAPVVWQTGLHSRLHDCSAAVSEPIRARVDACECTESTVRCWTGSRTFQSGKRDRISRKSKSSAH
ncbi:unnamed protein product [Protopolystoma xenopodis]|uniref:Uncharacterized protein n=1 Tax=Protopolystoma xenopodis TaxID=117903 RepID=A0A448WJC2_9PLAT|nr:unnamed protein product [Protopolystoma xenopodis]